MEPFELEQLVDDLFERSDRRLFELLHRIAKSAMLGVGNENEGLSQIPPASISNVEPSSSSLGNDNVAPSSRVWKTPINHTDYSSPYNPFTVGQL